MATITLNSQVLNEIPDQIKDLKKKLFDYKIELFGMEYFVQGIESNERDLSGAMNGAIVELKASTETIEEEIAELEKNQQEIEEFKEFSVKKDNAVASIVIGSKNDFYDMYSYLKPDCEKSLWEKAKEAVVSVAEWCKKHWEIMIDKLKDIATTITDLGVDIVIKFLNYLLFENEISFNIINFLLNYVVAPVWNYIISFPKYIELFLSYKMTGLTNFKMIVQIIRGLFKYESNELESPYVIYSTTTEHSNENLYGEQSKDTLLGMSTITEKDIEMSAEEHFEKFEKLVKIFSDHKLEKVALDMVEHFEKGNGTDYSNVILTQSVKEHENMQKFVTKIKGKVEKELSENGGDINSIKFTEEDVGALPYFGDGISPDLIGGLEICLHGLNSVDISISSYSTDGENFSGTLHFKFVDTFGLDENDLENVRNVSIAEFQYGEVAGFKSWYILQHYDAYNGKYRPFNTVIEFDVPFEGKVK